MRQHRGVPEGARTPSRGVWDPFCCPLSGPALSAWRAWATEVHPKRGRPVMSEASWTARMPRSPLCTVFGALCALSGRGPAGERECHNRSRRSALGNSFAHDVSSWVPRYNGAHPQLLHAALPFELDESRHASAYMNYCLILPRFQCFCSDKERRSCLFAMDTIGPAPSPLCRVSRET